MATPANDRVGLSILEKLNQIHNSPRTIFSELEARINAYEMAARLQLSAPEVTDLAAESEGTKKLYELDHPYIGAFGRQCLLARRLAERGVRFVQVYRGPRTPPRKRSAPTGTVMKIYHATTGTGDPFLIPVPPPSSKI